MANTERWLNASLVTPLDTPLASKLMLFEGEVFTVRRLPVETFPCMDQLSQEYKNLKEEKKNKVISL